MADDESSPWSGGNYSSRRQRALNKRNEADRRRRDELKAKQQNAQLFNILQGASGGPPSFSGSGSMGLSGRYSMGGSSAGKTGWGFDEVVTGYSSDFRPQEIKSKNIWFQYREGFQHGGGIKVGQWDTRDVRIAYKGKDDWQRKVNAAYWGQQSSEAEVEKLKEVQASIIPWDVYEKQQQGRWSGRKYGLSADTQSTLSSEASSAGEGTTDYTQGAILTKKETEEQIWKNITTPWDGVSLADKQKAAEAAKAEYKADPTGSWLGDWNMGKPESMQLSKDDLVSLGSGEYLGQVGPLTTERPSFTTYLGKNTDGKKNAANDTKMNFLYDKIISKMPNINIDVSHQDRDVVIASFIDKDKELTEREYELKQQLTTGVYYDSDGSEVGQVGYGYDESSDLKATITWSGGKSETYGMEELKKKLKEDGNKRIFYEGDDYEIIAEAKTFYGKLDASRKPTAKVKKTGIDIAILKSQLETVQDKKKLLATQKSAFMTTEESLLEADRINTESATRKKAMKELKDYKPFESTYGADYLNYLNPEDVSGFYERSQELPRLTATGVSSTYYNILGGSDYDPRLFEKYSTTYDPETHIYIKKPTGKIDGYGRQQYTHERIDIDEEGAIDFSKLDDATKKAIRSGDVGLLGYSQKQERAYAVAFDEGDIEKINEISTNPDKSINIRTAQQQQITDGATLAFLEKTYYSGAAEVDYTDINQLSERDNFLDSRGRLRDHERYGQAMGRLYFSTKKEVPTIKLGIESMQTEVDALRVEKKALDTTYRDYRSQIRERQEDVRETYKKTGKVDFDQGFADEISVFSKKRQAAKLALNIKEQKLDKLKKNLTATEEELESLREQKSDWLPSTEGGGGKIVNPARFAKYQMLAGHSTTSAMSPGERSARAQVRQRQVARTGKKVKGKINMISQYGRSSKDGWDDTFSSFDKLAGLKRQRTQLFRSGGI